MCVFGYFPNEIAEAAKKMFEEQEDSS